MGHSQRKRVLVVANRTAATARLLEVIRERAAEGPCELVLLNPDAVDRDAANWTLDDALPLEAIQAAVSDGHFDEIIISTLPKRLSHWLRRDLGARVERLGLPVTTVIPGHAEAVERLASPLGTWPGG